MACRHPRPRLARRAFTLVETVLAVLIVGAALAGILSMVTTSVSQMGQQKMQAAAVGFAAGQMNKFLFDTPFESCNSVAATEVIVDGTTFQYTLEVEDVPNSEILYKYKHLTYHDPRHGAAAATGAEPAVPGMTEEQQPVTALDSKFTAGGPILKDLLLTVKWHGPGEDYHDEFHLKLMTRKARL